MNEEKLNQLIDRINKLEEQLYQIKPSLTSLNSQYNHTESNMSDKMKSRQLLLEKIKTLYPGLMVTIAKRQDGGGLLLINKSDNKAYKVKFFYSKNYRDERLLGWFSVRTTDLYDNPYDFYAMSVDFNQKNHVFLFSQAQLKELLKQKHLIRDTGKSKEPIEHFYIEDINQKFYETRELNKNLDMYRGIVQGGINVSYAYQNFNVINDIIGDIKKVSNAQFITEDIVVIKNKIHEILKNQFLIPLNRKDFYYTGNLLQYIEVNLDDSKLSNVNMDTENLKSIILHINANSNTPLSVIHGAVQEINNLYKVPVLFGLTINDEIVVQSQLFVIGKKETI